MIRLIPLRKRNTGSSSAGGRLILAIRLRGDEEGSRERCIAAKAELQLQVQARVVYCFS